MPIETTPASADIQFLDDRIYEFNTSTTGIDNGAFLTILVRDDAGTIVRDCTAGRGETAARSRPSGCRQIAVAKDVGSRDNAGVYVTFEVGRCPAPRAAASQGRKAMLC